MSYTVTKVGDTRTITSLIPAGKTIYLKDRIYTFQTDYLVDVHQKFDSILQWNTVETDYSTLREAPVKVSWWRRLFTRRTSLPKAKIHVG